jgi:hypothetical protein
MRWLDNYDLVTFTSSIGLHGQWGPRLRWSIRRGWTGLHRCSSGLLGVLLGSWAFLALRWMTHKIVLRDVVVWHHLCLAAKPSHMGVDGNGLSCPLHRSTAYGCQTRVQSSFSDTILLYLVVKLICYDRQVGV